MAGEGKDGMQVLVAGATGFVGQAVVREALAREHQVFAMVRSESDTAFPVDPEARGRLATVPWGADPEALRRDSGLEAGVWVVNAAGLLREHPGLDPHRVHGDIARMVVALAEGLEASRLVHFGPLLSPTGDAFIHSKAEAEGIIRRARVPWSVVRSGPVYGPGDELLDEVGAWMVRSPVIPKFLEQVPLQPVWVGDLAAALLLARSGDQDVGGERLLWGQLLDLCAKAAGRKLLGPALADGTVRRLARAFGHRPAFMSLVPFNEAGFMRHLAGYEVKENVLAELLGHPPRTVADYLVRDWPYRKEPDRSPTAMEEEETSVR
jgi:NADH dehydrogenase